MSTRAEMVPGVIAGIAGVVLVISIFLPWFGPNDAQEGAIQEAQEITERFGGERLDEPDLTENAWQAFGFVDVVLLLTGVVGALTGALALAAPRGRPAIGPAATTVGLGILSTLLVLHRVINPIGEAAREYGLFIGFFAALGVAAGGWLALESRGRASTRRSADSIGSRRHG